MEQKTLNSQNNLEKKNNNGGIMLPDLKLSYKVIVIKTVWYQHKSTQITRTGESPEINPYIHDQLIYNKRAKNIQWIKGTQNFATLKLVLGILIFSCLLRNKPQKEPLTLSHFLPKRCRQRNLFWEGSLRMLP